MRNSINNYYVYFVILALIEFANKEFSNKKNLALTENMKKLKNLDCVHCPTLEIPVLIDLKYEIKSNLIPENIME